MQVGYRPLVTLRHYFAYFWRTLVMFDHFWDFDRLVEGGAQGEAEIA
jgi:hypothetical protein